MFKANILTRLWGFRTFASYDPQVLLTLAIEVHKISNVFCNGSKKKFLSSQSSCHYGKVLGKYFRVLKNFTRFSLSFS